MALRARIFRSLLAFSMLWGAACPQKTQPKPGEWKGPDPDTNSGPDAKRGGAKPMMINRAETDSVSWPKLVRTKWKRLDIQNPSVQNILDCELRIDNTGADLNIDIFNSLGTQIGFTPGPAPNKLKKLAVPLEDLGAYFVRIQAAAPKDESDFSVICNWEEKLEETPPPERPKDPTPVKNPRVRTPSPKKDPPPAQESTREEKIAAGLEGRILGAFREGSVYKLNLDKGEAAGIRVGMQGTVLSGRSGREPLEGGDFKVVKVIDASKCVAESGARSIGKNTRVVFFK